jgi:hypothetical protein
MYLFTLHTVALANIKRKDLLPYGKTKLYFDLFKRNVIGYLYFLRSIWSYFARTEILLHDGGDFAAL